MLLNSNTSPNRVISFNDDDETASNAIERTYLLYSSDYQLYFANGGDRGEGNVPEIDICKELGVEMLWGVGGGKIQSSSWLIGEKENEGI